ncbi:MAG: dehydratase [Actinobacteria bacterium]|nr:MAG: dehydratase [Actinomycetota bacterium]
MSGDVAVGDVVARATYPVERINLVMYAGASGDFNPIHWNSRVARAAGLPDVIAHGMFTMAQAGRAVTDWVGGDPGRVESFAVRFTRPVVVPDPGRARIEVEVVVAEVREDGTVLLDITATCDGEAVLGAASAVVRPG